MKEQGSNNHGKFFTWPVLVSIGLSAAVLWWFYFHITGYGPRRASSVALWLANNWNLATNDMEHAWLVPPLSAVMLYQARHRLAVTAKHIDWRGLLLVLLGTFLYISAFRIIQVRFAVFALPLIILGGIWYMAGFKTARISAVPVLFLWMMVPIPTFQQATVFLQMFATNMGHWGASLFGVDTYVQGTGIFSTHGNWDAYSVSGGCSGMRSLMALLMVSIVWAYLANLPLWKKVLLVAASIPLAVLGNAFRITSIVVLAEYVNPAFASQTWHDWSGLLLFFPIALLGLVLVHSALAGELPWSRKNSRKIIIRKGRKDSETPSGGLPGKESEEP